MREREKRRMKRYFKMGVIGIQGKGNGRDERYWGISISLVYPDGTCVDVFNSLCPLWNCSESPPLGKLDLYNKFIERNFTMGNCVCIKNKHFFLYFWPRIKSQSNFNLIHYSLLEKLAIFIIIRKCLSSYFHRDSLCA